MQTASTLALHHLWQSLKQLIRQRFSVMHSIHSTQGHKVLHLSNEQEVVLQLLHGLLIHRGRAVKHAARGVPHGRRQPMPRLHACALFASNQDDLPGSMQWLVNSIEEAVRCAILSRVAGG